MLNTEPSYYGGFSCIAGRCGHSCCIGWEIDIDEKTCQYYRSVGGSFGRRLQDSISAPDGVPCFTLSENERCPFLNDKNLCDIIIKLGEDKLCRICADHPRFRNFFSDRTEIGIGISCEAAARLILTYEPRVRLITAGRAEAEPTVEEERFFALRDYIFEIMQDREKTVDKRISELLLACGIDLPKKTPSEWAAVYASLERLDAMWKDKVEALAVSDTAVSIPADTEIQLASEQLVVYFLYRHMADGLYDGTIKHRIAFAVHAADMILRISGAVSVDEIAETARMYSAEIEYCSENLERILEELSL